MFECNVYVLSPRSQTTPWNLVFVAVEVGALGNTMKQTLLKASETLVKVVPGLSEDSLAKFKLVVEEPEHELRLRIYFLVARKK